MKLSRLRDLCNKAFEKYGEMDVGTYDTDRAHEVVSFDDVYGFHLRVINGSSLPGETLDEDEHSDAQPFLVIFCNA